MNLINRRTIEQMISDTEDRLLYLRAKHRFQSKVELSTKSGGMKQLLEQVSAVAQTNNSSISDVIKAIARIKNTKLIIESRKRQLKPSA